MLILNWFRQLALYGKVSPEDYEKLDIVYRTKEEVRTMLVATLEQERKKIYQQGKDAGVAEGQRQTLLQLLQYCFQLTEAESVQMAESLAAITEAQTLTALTNHGLQSTTAAEFTTILHTYLPTEKAQ